MKNYWFTVTFELGDRQERVWAPDSFAAKILAQANQIRKGNRYNDVDEIIKDTQ